MKIKMGCLRGLDRYAEIDYLFLVGFKGPAGERRLLDIAYQGFPTPGQAKLASETLLALNNLMTTPLYHFCGEGPQGRVAVLKKWVLSISLGAKPQLDQLDTPFGAEAATKLSYFCRVECSGGSGDPPTSLVGRDAAQYLFSKAEDAVASADDYTLDDLAVGKFFWLLSEQQVLQLKGWTARVVEGAEAQAVVPIADDKSVVAKKARAQKAQAEVAAEVAAAFI